MTVDGYFTPVRSLKLPTFTGSQRLFDPDTVDFRRDDLQPLRMILRSPD